MWVGLDGDRIVCAHMAAWRKVGNIRRDPRVALSIEADGKDDNGLDRYLVVHGTAEILEGGAPELLQRLARRLPRPRGGLPPYGRTRRRGFVTSITVDRIGGVGPWAG